MRPNLLNAAPWQQPAAACAHQFFFKRTKNESLFTVLVNRDYVMSYCCIMRITVKCMTFSVSLLIDSYFVLPTYTLRHVRILACNLQQPMHTTFLYNQLTGNTVLSVLSVNLPAKTKLHYTKQTGQIRLTFWSCCYAKYGCQGEYEPTWQPYFG
jgi:hypothetical protein